MERRLGVQQSNTSVVFGEQSILKLFRRLNREGATLVVVTHDERLAREASRTVTMLDGRIAAR